MQLNSRTISSYRKYKQGPERMHWADKVFISVTLALVIFGVMGVGAAFALNADVAGQMITAQ